MTKRIVIKKHYDKEKFLWLTNEEYERIIKEEKLTMFAITERFRTIITTKEVEV